MSTTYKYPKIFKLESGKKLRNLEIAYQTFGKLNAKKNKLFEETKASIKDYKPNFKQTWTENSQMKLFSHENDLLTLVYTGDGYSGGAHGYYYEFYDIFDLKNNKKIQLSEVVIDSKDTIWSKILMDNFLKNDLENGQAQMLLVKDIPLNDNFYFDKDSSGNIVVKLK